MEAIHKLIYVCHSCFIPSILEIRPAGTAVLAKNEPFLTKNLTQNREKFLTQRKTYMIF